MKQAGKNKCFYLYTFLGKAITGICRELYTSRTYNLKFEVIQHFLNHSNKQKSNWEWFWGQYKEKWYINNETLFLFILFYFIYFKCIILW